MRVLVTGGAGFIGRHLAVGLLQRSEEVIVVDDLRVEPLLAPVGTFLLKSVLNMNEQDLDGIDAVCHLASFKSVPESFGRPVEQLDNVDSARHLLTLCAKVGIPRVLVASTCEVYGVAHVPTAESHALSPRSPYAFSKAGMEMIAKAHQYVPGGRTEVTVVRLFNVYGPGERPDALVPSMCQNALLRGVLPIEGSGSQRRDLSYISDTVRHLMVILDQSPGGVVNVGSGISWSVEDIAHAVQALHSEARVEYRPERPQEIGEFLADVGRLRELDGLQEQVPLNTGLRQTFQWWSQRLGICETAPGVVHAAIEEDAA